MITAQTTSRATNNLRRLVKMAMEVTVPMVGKIVNVLVGVGDKVHEDDQIATLEAMKMEMPIVAPAGGVTKEFPSGNSKPLKYLANSR
jgi:acetyl-CoA carboxylase biotin carboxyl carrier protein